MMSVRRRTRIAGLLSSTVATLCALAPAAHAAGAPANDLVANAQQIWLGASAAIAQTTASSTAVLKSGDASDTEPGTSSAPSSSCPRMGRTVWFVVAGNGHDLHLSTAGSQINTAMAVYDDGANPTDGNRIGCSGDKDLAGGDTSADVVVKNALRGNRYLVQVGGQIASSCSGSSAFCAPSGQIALQADGAPRPVNDDRAAAVSLPTGTPTTADITGATTADGEIAACGTSSFAGTVWFRWTAPSAGTPRFDTTGALGAAGNKTVTTVYRASDGSVVGCDVDATGGGSHVALSATVPVGTVLLVQVGALGPDTPALGEGIITVQASYATGGGNGGGVDGDGDGLSPPIDCNDANAAIHPGAVDVPDNGIDEDCSGADASSLDLDGDGDGFAKRADCNDANAAIHPGAVDVFDNGVDEDCSGSDAVNPDRDGDGFLRPNDCNDGSAAIHPGAADVPGNGVDEDCSGADAPFPRLAVTVSGFSDTTAGGTRFHGLTVKATKPGMQVRLTCKGARCPITSKTVTVKKAGTVDVTTYLRGAKLAVGVRIEVRVTGAGSIGRVTRWTIRKLKAPTRVDLCLPPGEKKPGRCAA